MKRSVAVLLVALGVVIVLMIAFAIFASVNIDALLTGASI